MTPSMAEKQKLRAFRIYKSQNCWPENGFLVEQIKNCSDVLQTTSNKSKFKLYFDNRKVKRLLKEVHEINTYLLIKLKKSNI